MAPLPFLKLGGLLVKTLAKPMATRLKVEARKHPKFSQVCIRLGEAGHQISSRVNVFASGYKILGVNPLPEEEALSRGINIMSESFVFLVAAGIILYEYIKNEEKNARKAREEAEAEAQFRQYLESRLSELSSNITAMNERIKSLEEMIQSEKRSHENITKTRKQEKEEHKEEKAEQEDRRSWWRWFFYR